VALGPGWVVPPSHHSGQGCCVNLHIAVWIVWVLIFSKEVCFAKLVLGLVIVTMVAIITAVVVAVIIVGVIFVAVIVVVIIVVAFGWHCHCWSHFIVATVIVVMVINTVFVSVVVILLQLSLLLSSLWSSLSWS